MTRVRVQTFEETGATGEVWIRDTTSVAGGAYAAVPGGLPPDGDYGDIIILGGVWFLDLSLDQIPSPAASVDFVQEQALQFRIENRTSDPGAPAVGEIWLRTDL